MSDKYIIYTLIHKKGDDFIKKLKVFYPLIVAFVIIATLIILFATGAFDKPKETLITESTLTEVIETAKLTTAKYIQHGIAKAHIEGKEDGYVLYYAVVRPNVNLEDITYEIDNENKKVTVIVPNEFAFDVELLEDEEHKRYCYPKEPDDWTDKDVRYICEADAKQKAKDNADLITKARESLINTIEALLAPVARSGYTVDVRVAQEV